MDSPKIVFFDLETLPNLKEILKVFPSLGQWPGRTLKASINSIICFGFKELGKDHPVKVINAWDFENWTQDVNDDGPLVRAAYEILSEADAVVTYNGIKFDWPFFQTRLIKNGLAPLNKQIKHIDVCRVIKRNLFLYSNSLKDTGPFFTTDKEKMEHEGWSLWVKTHWKDPEAMKTMSEYCSVDVLVLEELFNKVRPFINDLPNYNLFHREKEHVCPKCASTRLHPRGYYLTKTRRYKRYVCEDCNSWSRTDARDEAMR